MSVIDKAKLVKQFKKVRKELKREIIEVEGGDGAVVVEITGEQKLKKIHIDPDRVNLKDIETLESWIEDAVREAIQQSQQVAAAKMRPYVGMLGNLDI